jgi:hypothetical protein
MARAGRKDAVKVAIGAAAIGVATSVTAVAVTLPASISSSLVDLTALIVVGSSTNPSGAGVADFFGGKFRDEIYTGPNGDDIVTVNFYDGPAGIQAAINDANQCLEPGQRNAVLASGWGAANASLLLLNDNPSLGNTTFILDNDVARPDGGFGTRYPLFALIGVNPIPTPSQTPASWVVNTGYEYDYNSNAPAYVLNPFSAVNALAAYLTTRLNQAEIDLPVDAEGRPIAPDGSPLTCGGANTCAITESQNVLPCPDARCSSPGDRITAYVTTRNNTTYVTYTTRELPLTTLIRGIFGDYIANVSAPLLKWAVDLGYYGGNPIPSDPSAYRPGRLFPSIGDIFTALIKLPGAILETLAAIVAPFFPRPPAVTNTQMLTTETLSTTETSTNETGEELTPESNEEHSETNERLAAGTNGELTETPEELTTETNEELTAPGNIIEETTKPLMNVLRNSLTALPGGFAVGTGNGSTPTTVPESVEPEPNSELHQGTAPIITGPPDIDTGIDGTDPDSKPGDTDDDGSPQGGEPAAA